MAQETSGYYHAIEVLPFELVDNVIDILKISTKVTFAPSHRPLNRSEMLLPPKLVDKCREELDKKDIVTRRVVLFGTTRDHEGTKAHAYVLADIGHTLKVIADALNYHPVTLKRWGMNQYIAAKRLASPKVDPSPEALNLGFARCQELRPGEEGSASHYQMVGTALLALRSRDVLALVKKRMAQERKALGGAKRW